MTHFIKTLLVITFCFGMTQAETIWPAKTDAEMAGKIGILTENHAKNVLGVLESMPWIEEGNQQGEGKYMYVLYSPSSPNSKALYAQTRPYLDQVNIRWIPIIVGDISVDGLYETRTPEALKNAFEQDIIPQVNDHETTDLISNMTFTGFIYLRSGMMFSPEARSYFPTVIYGDSNKLYLDITFSDIKEIIHDIPLTTPNTTQPTMMDLAQQKFTLYSVEKHARYQNEGDKLTSVFLYPSENGINTGSFGYEKDPIIISGITDNGYAAIDVNGRGNYIYIKYIKDKHILIEPSK